MARSIDAYLAYIEAIRSLSPQTVCSYRKDLACSRLMRSAAA
jgi:site-specific recombinase XerC